MNGLCVYAAWATGCCVQAASVQAYGNAAAAWTQPLVPIWPVQVSGSERTLSVFGVTHPSLRTHNGAWMGCIHPSPGGSSYINTAHWQTMGLSGPVRSLRLDLLGMGEHVTPSTTELGFGPINRPDHCQVVDVVMVPFFHLGQSDSAAWLPSLQWGKRLLTPSL